MLSLKRTRVGQFEIDDSLTLNQISALLLKGELGEYIIAADDVFDFSCVVMATADSRVTVKLCQIDDDDNQAFYKNDVQLKAGKLQVIKFADCKFAKGAASPVKLIYDFGGCEAGVDFVIANITIIKK